MKEKSKIRRIFNETIEDFLVPSVDVPPNIAFDVETKLRREFENYCKKTGKLTVTGTQALFNDIYANSYNHKDGYGLLLRKVSNHLSLIYDDITNQPEGGHYQPKVLKYN